MAKVFADDISLTIGGAYVVYHASTISDNPPGGNGDSIINPGETVRMQVWARNWGGQTAHGVSAILRSLDPCMVVTDSEQTFGDIAPGDSACTVDGFEFRVADTCSNGHALGFRLVCRDAGDSTWLSAFSRTVGACVMAHAGWRVNDPRPGGNGNGRLDAGETAEYFIELRNTGLGHAYNLQARLKSADPLLVVIDSMGAYSRIRAGETGENTADPFKVQVDRSVVPGTEMPCTLHLTGDNHYAAVLPISIVVGELESFDPIHDNMTPAFYWAIDDIDSTYSGAPRFNWIEARGHDCLHLAQNSTFLLTLPAAFGPFKMYNQRYTFISICSNGWLCGGITSNTTGANSLLPNGALPGAAVCANWDELNPTTGNNVWTYHDVANHAFVIEWDSVAYADGLQGADKFEIVIFDTTLAAASGNNVVLLQYQTANGFASSTVGIQDPTQTYGITCLCDSALNPGSAAIRAGRAIKFTTDVPAAAVHERRANVLRVESPRLAVENPFRGASRIRYSLPSPAPVRLAIYDVSGQEVRLLAASGSATPAGSYSMTWDGRDHAGRAVAQGVYLCRMETGAGTISAKAVKLE